MFILECAFQPHLWGTHPPNLVSHIPLAALPCDWQPWEHFSSCARMPGGRYGEFWPGTNDSREMSGSQAGLWWNKTHQWGVSPKFVSRQTQECCCWNQLWLVRDQLILHYEVERLKCGRDASSHIYFERNCPLKAGSRKQGKWNLKSSGLTIENCFHLLDNRCLMPQ